MWRYALRRVLLALFIVWLVSFLTFSLVRFIPGDVIDHMVAEQGALYAKSAKQLRHSLGLDKPILQQYGEWIGNVFRGNLGTSLWEGTTVAKKLSRALPVSIELGIVALLIAWFLAIPIGIISAIRQDTPLDYGGRLAAIGGLSMPDFWLGTMTVLYLALWFRYQPPLPYVNFWTDPSRNLEQIYLPAIIMGFRLSATTMRMTRSAMLEVLRQDFIRTAWAKGLRERAVVFRHAMKNAMIPVVTIMGGQLPMLIGGTVIMETVFAIPGVGRLTFTAVMQRDYPQIQANVLVLSSIIVLVNLVVDLSYGWFDPRIRYA